MSRRDLFFLIVAIFAVVYFLTMRLYWDIVASPIRGTDFSSYYTAGTLVRTGHAADLYSVAPGDAILGDATAGAWRAAGDAAGIARQHYYIYPPLFAVLFAPLSLLSFGAAMNLWMGLDLALLVVFLLLYATYRGADLSWPEAAFMISACLFEFLPLIWAMAIGQTSLIVLVLLTGTLLAWRRGSDVTAGLLLGLAIALKLTPALLAVFFLWRGRRRIAWISAGVFLAAQAVSVAAIGWEPHRRFFLDVVPMMSGGTCYFLNQSIGSFFNRMVTDGDVRQVAIVSSTGARLLTLLASLALIAVSAPFLRRERADVHGGEEIQYGVVVLLTLVLSPISWTHHYLIALLPLFALIAHLGREGSPPLGRAVLLGIAVLLVARKPHADLFVSGWARLFNSAALAGALVMWALSLHALRRRPEVRP